MSSCISRVTRGVSFNAIESEGPSMGVPCSVPSGGAIMSKRVGSVCTSADNLLGRAGGCRGIHIRAFPSCRLCGVPCQSGGVGRRDAGRWQVEVVTDAGALCQSGVGRAGRDCSVQRKERETMIYHIHNLTGCLVVLKSEASMRQFLRDRQRSVDSKMRKAIKAGAS